MKSYLGLVSEYAKVHKKKNRLTVVCIAISVMLVTAIFGMADLSIKSQTSEAIRQFGNWHIILADISDTIADKIESRRDVKVSSWFGMTEDTTYQGKELIVQGSSKELAEQMSLTVTEGRYPITPQEALLDKQGLQQFGLSIGDTMEVAFGDGQTRQFTISGTYGDFSTLKGEDAHGLQLTSDGIRALPANQYLEYYYIQFDSGVNINRALSEIKSDYGLTKEQVFAENVILLGLMGQSGDATMLQVYLTAAVLFVLVTMAGTFMITSSFNMSVLERTQFFGMLRCIGATKKQVKRYVRLEGLLYCVKAIPIGLLSGCVVLWVAIFTLNQLNSQYLPPMPMFQISMPSVIAGALIGIVVVMIASNSPAKQAARVSPGAAITGNLSQTNDSKILGASNTKLFHVDTAMGLRHAFSNKKGMVFIAGSFAVSIILFLCFSILITFMNHALAPLKPYSPDLSIQVTDDSALLDHSLKKAMQAIPNAEKVYGRMFLPNIPASAKHGTGTVKLVSYDEPQFEWAKKSLISGSVDYVQNGNGILVDYGYSKELGWEIGDTITLDVAGQKRQVQVAGILSDVPIDPESGEWIIISSERTFTALTGMTGYTVIDMQISQDISEQVRGLITPETKLLDLQQRNHEVRTVFFAVSVFIYGFLMVIAFVALINIINTVNASVASRIGHYGVMRAVGMSGKQLKKVVRAEAATYAITGSITGGILGVLLHRFFFEMLISSNWGQTWQPPVAVLFVTITAAIFTTFIAVVSPTKKIEETSIVDVVNAG